MARRRISLDGALLREAQSAANIRHLPDPGSNCQNQAGNPHSWTNSTARIIGKRSKIRNGAQPANGRHLPTRN